MSIGEPDGAPPSIHSEHTDLENYNFEQKRMAAYLKDCDDEFAFRLAVGNSGEGIEVEEEAHLKEIALERVCNEQASLLVSCSQHTEPCKQKPHRSHHKSRSLRSKSKSHRHSARHERKRNEEETDTIIVKHQEEADETNVKHQHKRIAETNRSNEISHSLTSLTQRPPTLGDAQHNLSPSVSQPLSPSSMGSNNVASGMCSYQLSNTSTPRHVLSANSSSNLVKPQNEMLEQLTNTSRYICPETNSLETVSRHVINPKPHVSTTIADCTPPGNQPTSVTTPMVYSLDTYNPPISATASGYVEARTKPDVYSNKPSLLRSGEHLSISGYIPSNAAAYDTTVSQTFNTSNRYVSLPEGSDFMPAGGDVTLPESVDSMPTFGHVTLPEGADSMPAVSSTSFPIEFADDHESESDADVPSPDSASLNSSVFVSDDCHSFRDSPPLSPTVGATAEMRNQSLRMETLSSGEFSEVFVPVSDTSDQFPSSVCFNLPEDNGYVTNNDFEFHCNKERNTALYSRSSSEGYYSAHSTPLTPKDEKFVLPQPQGVHVGSPSLNSPESSGGKEKCLQEEKQTQTIIDQFSSQEQRTLSHHLPFDRKMGTSIGYVGESDFFSSEGSKLLPHTTAPLHITTESNSTQISSSLTSSTTISQPTHPKPTAKPSYFVIPSLLPNSNSKPAAKATAVEGLQTSTQLQLSDYQNTADIDLSTTRLDFPAETSSF